MGPTSRREVYAGVVEVSIYVLAATRGRGIGKVLLQALVEASERADIWTLQSSVFPENKITIALHQGAGFQIVGKREKIARHHGIWRDTVVLERRSRIVGV